MPNISLKSIFTILLTIVIGNTCFAFQKEEDLRAKILEAKDTALVDAYFALSKYYYATTGKGDSLIHYGLKSRDLAKSIGSTSHLIESYRHIGAGYIILENYTQAEKYLKEGLQIAGEHNDFFNEANLHNKLGTVYQNQGQFVKAIDQLVKAAKKSELGNDYRNSSQAYYGISLIYAQQNQYEKQLDYINKALKNIREHPFKDPLLTNIIYNYSSQQYLNLFKKFNRSKYLDSTRVHALEALDIANKNTFEVRKLSSHTVLSSYYMSKKDYEKASEYALKVLDKKQLVHESVIINIYFNLAQINKEYNRKEKALSYIDSIHSLKLKEQPYYGAKIADFSYKILTHFGENKRAIDQLELRIKYLNDINEKEKSKAINEIETKYQSEIKDIEIKNLSQQKKINELEIENKKSQVNWLIAFMLIAFSITAIILYVVRTMQLKKERLTTSQLKSAINEQMRLEKKLSNVRENVAQDFHDDLGNKLARMSFLSNLVNQDVSEDNLPVKNKLTQITEDANSLFKGTKDFIFSLKQSSDFINELSDYLIDFGEEFFSKTQIQFSAEKDITINERLPYYWSKQLIFIFKEAMTNALKHSQATHVSLRFKFQDNKLSIVCTDNGIGFHQKNDLDSGLSHMKQRAEKINGTLEINTNESGTTISFYNEIPIR